MPTLSLNRGKKMRVNKVDGRVLTVNRVLILGDQGLVQGTSSTEPCAEKNCDRKQRTLLQIEVKVSKPFSVVCRHKKFCTSLPYHSHWNPSRH